jgi:hypothetical protein
MTAIKDGMHVRVKQGFDYAGVVGFVVFRTRDDKAHVLGQEPFAAAGCHFEFPDEALEQVRKQVTTEWIVVE